LNPVFSKKNISASTIRYRRAEVSAKVLLSMVLFPSSQLKSNEIISAR
jgi:hypothetical protein